MKCPYCKESEEFVQTQLIERIVTNTDKDFNPTKYEWREVKHMRLECSLCGKTIKEEGE